MSDFGERGPVATGQAHPSRAGQTGVSGAGPTGLSLASQNFSRRPSGAGEWTADLLRLACAVSVVVAGIGWGLDAAAVFALTLFGTLVPRVARIRPALDIPFAVALIVASWSGILDLYTAIAGWDIVVHFATNGLLAAVAVVLAQRVGWLSGTLTRFAAIVVTTMFGLAAGSVWEMIEWAGHTFIDPSVFVGYEDSIGDMAAGGLGSLVAGCAVPYFARAAGSTPPARTPRIVGGPF